MHIIISIAIILFIEIILMINNIDIRYSIILNPVELMRENKNIVYFIFISETILYTGFMILINCMILIITNIISLISNSVIIIKDNIKENIKTYHNVLSAYSYSIIATIISKNYESYFNPNIKQRLLFVIIFTICYFIMILGLLKFQNKFIDEIINRFNKQRENKCLT